MMIAQMMIWLACSAAALPVGSAENAGIDAPSGGLVAPGIDAAATLAALVQAVHADAVRRSGLDEARLVMQAVEDVSWSDGSLGCPQPDRSYTQALVPGWRIRIEAGTRVLYYHTSRRGQWLLCPAGRAAAPAPGAVWR